MMNFKIPSLLFFLFVAFNAGTQSLESQIDEILAAQFPADGPGASALVVKNGQILYRKAFGKANIELDVAMKPEHVFRIGSISKQFTACAILRLAELGKLSLQDEITKFIPDYPTHGHKITVEHLLTHTSGIKSYTGLEKWTDEERKRDFTPKEMVDYFKDEPMDFAPGEAYRYNNSAYFLLGYIIEIVSGKTYEAFLDENFFKPLGMNHSYYGNTAPIIKNRAAGYQEGETGNTNADFLSMTQPYAAGSLLSNVDDLYTWYKAVMDDKVVSKESRMKAHTAFKLNNGKPTGYGYGWSLGNVQGSPVIGHGGGINGFLTASLYLPDEKVFVALFSNCTCKGPDDAAYKMAGIAIGKPFKWEKIEMPAAELKAYEAIYESETGEQRILTFEDGKMYSARTGGSKFLIHPYAKDKFFFDNSLTTLEFIRDPKGAIASVVSKSTSDDITWMRTDKPITKLTAIEIAPEWLEKYPGKYQLAPGFILTITKEGNQLFAQATGQDKLEILPYELHKFYTKSIDAKMVFNSDNTGKVTSLTLLQNGEHKADRIE